jgi:Zn-dependent protease/predicted transcriptional regulator
LIKINAFEAPAAQLLAAPKRPSWEPNHFSPSGQIVLPLWLRGQRGCLVVVARGADCLDTRGIGFPRRHTWPNLGALLGDGGLRDRRQMAHSLVARHYGLPIRGITLFIFGGVAEMTAEPNRPRDELLMAAAGPAASLFLAAICYALLFGVAAWEGPAAVAGVLWYLALINFILALFNLVPAFPLDGGRIFRAALWSWRGDLVWATRIAAGAGNLFGAFLIVLGLIDVLQGNFVGGMWRFLIGMFLRGAASASYSETLARRLLADVPVARIMNSDPITVTCGASVQAFIDDYVYRYHHRWFPVVDDGTVMGSMTMQQAASMDRAHWPVVPVGQVMRPLSPDDAVGPDTDAFTALMQMRRSGQSRLMVLHHGRLFGMVSSRDLLDILSLERELHGYRSPPTNRLVPP